MSQENVELYQQAIDALNRCDRDAFLAFADDDLEAESAIVAMEGGVHGPDGMRRWWENMFTVFSDYKLEVVEVRDLGDLTVASLRARGRGAGSDVPFDTAIWQVARWRQRKCMWWRMFDSWDEALEAVGLSE